MDESGYCEFLPALHREAPFVLLSRSELPPNSRQAPSTARPSPGRVHGCARPQSASRCTGEASRPARVHGLGRLTCTPSGKQLYRSSPPIWYWYGVKSFVLIIFTRHWAHLPLLPSLLAGPSPCRRPCRVLCPVCAPSHLVPLCRENAVKLPSEGPPQGSRVRDETVQNAPRAHTTALVIPSSQEFPTLSIICTTVCQIYADTGSQFPPHGPSHLPQTCPPWSPLPRNILRMPSCYTVTQLPTTHTCLCSLLSPCLIYPAEPTHLAVYPTHKSDLPHINHPEQTPTKATSARPPASPFARRDIISQSPHGVNRLAGAHAPAHLLCAASLDTRHRNFQHPVCR